jgi:hypothetical protein
VKPALVCAIALAHVTENLPEIFDLAGARAIVALAPERPAIIDARSVVTRNKRINRDDAVPIG